MTANASAHRLQILIGSDNQDWSRALVSFEAGRDKRDRNGLIKTTGSLELAAMPGLPESLNPRTNQARWFRGQRVIINITNTSDTFTRHPCGWLYVTAEPQTPHPGSPKLTLQLGCILTLRDFAQPDNDAAGVQLGSATARGAAIANLLYAAGITTWQGDVPAYPINYPIPKQGGGYVQQAGEPAYGGLKALWQDNQGNIQAVDVAAQPASPILTVTIGSNEIAYEPSDGGETPCEQIKACGTKSEAKDNWTTVTSAPEERGDASAIDPSLSGEITFKRTEITDTQGSGGKTHLEVTREPIGLVVPDSKGTDLIVSSVTQTTYTYDGDKERKLRTISGFTRKPYASALSSYWSQRKQVIEDTKTQSNPPALLASLTLPDPTELLYTEKFTTNYSYTDKGVVRSIVTTRREVMGAIVADELIAMLYDRTKTSGSTTSTTTTVSGTLEDPTPLKPVEISTLSYTELRKDEWRKDSPSRTIAGKSGKTFTQPEPEDRIKAKLALTSSTSDPEVSRSGQCTPPAAERQAERFSQEEKPIEATAGFQISAGLAANQQRQRTIEVPYATDTGQLYEVAKNEGALLIGRKQGQRIQIPLVDALLSNPAPLTTWQAVEPDGTMMIFTADAISYTHDLTHAVAGSEGIWIASREAPPLTPIGVTPPIPPLRLPFTEVRPLSGGTRQGGSIGEAISYAPTVTANPQSGGTRQGGAIQQLLSGGTRQGGFTPQQNPLLQQIKGAWRFNSADNFNDQVGSSNLSNTYSDVTLVTGWVGQAANMPLGSELKVNSNAALVQSGAFTIAFIYRPTRSTINVVGKFNDLTNLEYLIRTPYDSASLTITLEFRVGSTVVGSPVILNTQRYLIVASNDPTNSTNGLSLFTKRMSDGVETLNTAPGVAAVTNTYPFRLQGGVGGVGNSWVDALHIWSRVLSSADRLSLYNSGTGLEYPFS